eukprot:SAG25_NODE_4474_length_807_cov_1.052260_1_plen_128_part_10
MQTAWQEEDWVTCQSLPDQLLDTIYEDYVVHARAVRSHQRTYGPVGQTATDLDHAIAAAANDGAADDDVLQQLRLAREAHRSAVHIASLAHSDEDAAERASFGDPRALSQLKRAAETPAQFSSQKVVH